MTKLSAKPTGKALGLLLALAVLVAAFTGLGLPAKAAGTPTSLGLGEHGIMAHTDGWLYQYGGKGETVNGVRVSDCAGLIYSYFKDLGNVTGIYGGASSQVKYNCVFSGDIDELDGIPRIHGLVLTMPNYDGDTLYSHIGIYIGNNMAVDNSDAYYNMRRAPVVGSGRDWTAWHVFGMGMQYPSNGWYEFDGALYHYSNCQYDVNTTVDGYTIGSDGIALDAQGDPLVPGAEGTPSLSQEYVSADTVAGVLRDLGYDGEDNTGNSSNDDKFNGKITGSGVRLRQEPTTASAQVGTLALNTPVIIEKVVTGQSITADGQTSDQWCYVTTASNTKGYVSAIYVEWESTLPSPTFSVENDMLVMSASEGCEIRYTTDGTHPTSSSDLYAGPLYLSGTYHAIALKDGWASPMSNITFAGGSLFTDFTSDAWYFSQVDTAVELGLFSGSDGKFNPTSNITRAEFAAALTNLAGADVSQYTGESSFSDVGNQWYNGAVNWVHAMGYMSGMGDGTFAPTQPITREQMCVTLANYANLTYSGNGQPFADDGQISSWAKDAVYACRELNLISGMGDNLFAPKNNAQRVQACVVILNAYNAGL